MNKLPSPKSRVGSSASTAHLILEAARACFDARGFEKTGVDDIALAARVSRQTVYRYFENKQDIIEKIGLAEAALGQQELFSRVADLKSTSMKITETIIFSIEVARSNPYVRKIVESAGLQLVDAGMGSGNVYTWLMQQWLPLLEHGIKMGELRPDAADEQIVRWILLAEVMLFIRIQKTNLAEDELRAFIARFIVDPLRRVDDQTNSLELHSSMRNQIIDLQALVVEQALQLSAIKAKSSHRG